IYPSWDSKTPRHAILKDFFAELQKNIKAERPEIILSADLFGYVANQGEDATIGQRLTDIAPFFDYLSFMVYPSHYYAGLMVSADSVRNLPAVNYTVAEARANPDIVVGRSLLAALDFLNPAVASSTAASAKKGAGDMLQQQATSAAVRPWLEDFFHEQDRLAGRPYGAQKVRMQIDAAEKSGGNGWLLWNASNVYSESALKKE
ncbi:MAG: putative glycoside hydrolase, partial [Candidatus Sungiibacteriota bacterium]